MATPLGGLPVDTGEESRARPRTDHDVGSMSNGPLMTVLTCAVVPASASAAEWSAPGANANSVPSPTPAPHG
jgi:hypothetical protein